MNPWTSRHLGWKSWGLPFIDTVKVKCADAHAIANAPYKSEMNLWVVDIPTLWVCLPYFLLIGWVMYDFLLSSDWGSVFCLLGHCFLWWNKTTLADIEKLFKVFAGGKSVLLHFFFAMIFAILITLFEF